MKQQLLGWGTRWFCNAQGVPGLWGTAWEEEEEDGRNAEHAEAAVTSSSAPLSPSLSHSAPSPVAAHRVGVRIPHWGPFISVSRELLCGGTGSTVAGECHPWGRGARAAPPRAAAPG